MQSTLPNPDALKILGRVLRIGPGAYWDTFAGLVPVRVLSIAGENGLASTSQKVRFRVVRDHGPYKRGEEHERSADSIVPKSAVRRRRYSTTIRAYAVECSEYRERPAFELVRA